MHTHESRMALAQRSLTGLSVGDAFGERFFGSPDEVMHRIIKREVPTPHWRVTDDTVMALSVVDVLARHRRIDQDALAELFAARYRRDPMRGYGAGAHEVLQRIDCGEHWNQVSFSAFRGQGSMGNGAAMRAAPVGAYFMDDLGMAAASARRSAKVTHAHPDGQAGAMAVAVAAAWIGSDGLEPGDLFQAVLKFTPPGPTRDAVDVARTVPLDADVDAAVAKLGNGARVTSADTVPFCLWCVARHLGKFEEALWAAVSGLGDRDTTCAIVGGIAALHPRAQVPVDWMAAREPLDALSV